MFLERLQSYIKGYVDFQARGGFPERFINLCSANFLNIQNVKMYRETITASCDIKSYLKIRPVAKKSGMKVHLIKKHGFPFWLHRKRKRIGIVAGFVFFIVITYFLSGYIWTVKVNGNETIPAEEIIASFYSLGVKIGIKKDSIDPKEIARKALAQMDGLMWTAVNVNGCKITIEVKERVVNSIQEEDDTPSNIIASNSGQIILIENFLGTPVADVGSAVEKGDVIVSGAVINKDESVSLYKAEANVIARTKNTVHAYVPGVCEMRVYQKVKRRYFLDVFGVSFAVSLPVKGDGVYTFSSGEDYLKAEKDKLPVGIITQRYAFYDTQKVKLTKSAMKLMCAEKYFKEIDAKFDDIEIEKMTSETKNNKSSYEIRTVFECIENIGESKKMDIKIENDTSETY